MIEYLRTSLEGGACISETLCFPTWRGLMFGLRRPMARVLQRAWLDKHGKNVFTSEGRIYADVRLLGQERIIDAVTGTLFDSRGLPIGDHDLRVNLTDISRDENLIWSIVEGKY